MAPHSKLSVIIPALNEAENIGSTVRTVLSVSPAFFSQTELILVDDGSTDDTRARMQEIARRTPDTLLIQHERPRNLGGAYAAGLARASGEYVILVPGDNECSANVLQQVLSRAGAADIIIPYSQNSQSRGRLRHLLSRSFVGVLNLISGHHLTYYNGSVLHRTHLVRSIEQKTFGFGYQAELLVKLLKNGASYEEVETQIGIRSNGKSKAFRLKNLWQTATFLLRLAFD